MKTPNELMVKALSLKTRVALLGAPYGNKNAAGPHDGSGDQDRVDNLPRVSGNFKPPKIDKMRAALDKKGISHSHISKTRSLLDQRTMLQELIKKQGLKLEDFT